MKVLFVHQNFPAQFANVATLLASQPDREVVAIGSNTARALPLIKLIRYTFSGEGIHSVHPFLRRLETEARRAEQVLYIGSDLLASGFYPDLIFVHCGWGESLPLRSVFPAAKIVTYLEYFYQPRGLDTDFDPEWPALSLDSVVASEDQERCIAVVVCRSRCRDIADGVAALDVSCCLSPPDRGLS